MIVAGPFVSVKTVRRVSAKVPPVSANGSAALPSSLTRIVGDVVTAPCASSSTERSTQPRE